MTANKTHWPSILILVIFGIAALFLLVLSAGLAIGSTTDFFNRSGDPAGEMIVAVAYAFELLVLLVCSWFVLQRSLGHEQSNFQIKLPYSEWQIFAILAIIIFAVVIGEAAAYSGIKWLTWITLPIFSVLVIVPPIWIIFGIGTKGIEIGKRWHVFTVLGLGLTVGPIIMIVLELVVLAGTIVMISVILAIQQPPLLQELIRVGKLLRQESDPDLILNTLAPFIKNPLIVATLIGYIALLVPLIEELFKPLAVWIFAKELSSPAQGFALGMLSGGAFALIESLNASGDGSVSWGFIVVVRAGTSLLHMTTSGLVGWGIATAVGQKRISRFFPAYFTSVCIHGIWNACAAGMGILFITEPIGFSEQIGNFAPALICGMLLIGLGMFPVLMAFNRKLKRTANLESVQVNTENPRIEENEIEVTPK